MIIVLIGGKARVGKTTLANIIAEYCVNNNLTPRMVPFAYGIKKAAELKGLTKTANPKEYRDFCQTLGESMRIKNPDHWVDEWRLKIAEIEKEEQVEMQNNNSYKERIVIVDDCRYMNEVAIGRKLGANCIFVKQGKRIIEDDSASWREHPSEELANRIETKDKNYSDIFKYIIPNDSTQDVFKKHANKNIPTWLGLLADGGRPECDCEICKANRENRDPDAQKVMEELLDILEKTLEEEGGNNESCS